MIVFITEELVVGRSYPEVFRRKVVDAYEGSYREIGERFCVGETSVNRWVGLERYTGSVLAKVQGRPPGATKATPEFVALVRSLVEDEASVTSSEIARTVEQKTGIALCQQIICKVLKRSGYSSKRGACVRQFTEPNG
ncbi:MAG: transposase [Myxococcota bacterium]|jgi:transposase